MLLLNSPWKDDFLQSAVGPLQLKVATGEISASWLSPIVARGVEIKESDDRPVATIHALRTSQNLLSLLLDRQDLGTITLERPQLQWDLRSDGSNLEDLIARSQLIATTGERQAVTIEIIEGSVAVRDQQTQAEWTIRELSATAVVGGGAEQGVTTKLSAVVEAPDVPSGSLTGDVSWKPPQNASAEQPNSCRMRFQFQQLPLQIATPLLRRAAPQSTVLGRLNGGLQLAWGATDPTARFEQLVIRDFELSLPTYLGGDRIRSSQVEIVGSLEAATSNWQAHDFQVATDFARLSGEGSGYLSHEETLSAQQRVWQFIEDSQLQLEGEINLAELMNMLPQSFHLRDDVRISSGAASFDLASSLEADVQRWQGRLMVSHLEGRHGARSIRLAQPVKAQLEGRRQGADWSLDRLAYESSFLALEAHGTIEQGAMTLESDLNRFVAELGPLVDWGGVELAGNLESNIEWRYRGDDNITIEANTAAREFAWIVPGRPAWEEKLLEVSLSVSGRGNRRRLQQIDRGELTVSSGVDVCSVVLTAPVSPISSNSAWPFQLSLEGEIPSWLSRIDRLTPTGLAGWEGNVSLTGSGVASADQLQLDAAKVNLRQFVASFRGVGIREPIVQIETAGTWDFSQRLWTSETTSVASSSLAFRAAGVQLAWKDKLRLSGVVGYRADLQRVAAWAGLREHRFIGQIVGKVQLVTTADATDASWSSEVRDFEYQLAIVGSDGALVAAASHRAEWESAWAEPELQFTGEARWDAAADQVQLSSLALAGRHVRARADGSIRDVSRYPDLELNGQWSYDLQPLSAQLQRYLGQGVSLAGRSEHPFSIRTPLHGDTGALHGDTGALQGDTGALQGATVATTERAAVRPAVIELVTAMASLSWDQAEITGFQVGPGLATSHLQHGILAMEPMRLDVSEGKVNLTPRFDLRGQSTILQQPPGKILENLRLSPATCQTWLKYVAPLVASATAADGRFSVTVDETVIPLDDWTMGDVQGVLEVHSAQIGPGPLAQQLLWLADQVKAVLQRRPLATTSPSSSTWLRLPDQRVGFRVHQGRVEHRGLEMVVDDVVIRTSGTVDRDQNLALVAEVPIRDEWVANDRWLSAMRGQTIQVPVSGTLEQPKLDKRVLDQLARQFATGAATQFLEREVTRGLERLFGQ
jgi:hypothetical protein